MNNVPETTTIITTYSNPDRWMKIHGQFLVHMFDGHFDDAYIAKLQNLASGHQAIGVLSTMVCCEFSSTAGKYTECSI